MLRNLGVALSFITLSRYSAMSNEQGALTWVSLYSGEGFYRFADLMWYKNDVVMLGDDISGTGIHLRGHLQRCHRQ